MRKFFLVLLFSALTLTACSPVVSPLAYADYRSCLKVKPGMSEREVVDIMGDPQYRSTRTSGELQLQYREEFGASGPIEITLKRGPSGDFVDFIACQGLG
jgi:hypothetical protein